MADENGVDQDKKEKITRMSEISDKAPRLMKGMAYFYYNVNHSLRMVSVKPVTDTVFTSPVFTRACQTAHTFRITRNKDNQIEAVLYYRTMDEGDTAFIDLKKALEEVDCVVSHPNFLLSLSAGQYWSQLSSWSSVAEPPISETEAKLELLFRRQVILEEMPDLTAEELYEYFPEVSSVLCYPHGQNTQGIYMLEFHNDIKADNFLTKRVKESKITVGGATAQAHLYHDRLVIWKREKNASKTRSGVNELSEHTYSDEERVAACRRLQEEDAVKLTMLNRTDLHSEEKILELRRRHIELAPLKENIRGDTNRRKLHKLDFPEPAELQPAYTKFVLGQGFGKMMERKNKSSHVSKGPRGTNRDRGRGRGTNRGRDRSSAGRQQMGQGHMGSYEEFYRGGDFSNRGYQQSGFNFNTTDTRSAGRQQMGQGHMGSYEEFYRGGDVSNHGYNRHSGHSADNFNVKDQLTEAIEGLTDALSANMMGSHRGGINNYGFTGHQGRGGSNNYGFTDHQGRGGSNSYRFTGHQGRGGSNSYRFTGHQGAGRSRFHGRGMGYQDHLGGF